ncbi:MAG: transcription antiterminator [Selenomonadaceae bacterium]|nr:transcription antiterminator [Selenomonadaceae bacterium]
MILEMDKSVAEISVSKRNGYRLEIHDADAAQKIYDMNINVQTEGRKRTNYITCALLEATFLGEPLKQQKLSDELFVSLTAFKAGLRDAKTQLEKYDLSVVNFKNYGMTLDGAERDIRHCISDFIFQNSKQRNHILSVLPIKIDAGKIRSIVIRVMSSYDIMLTDDSLERFIGYIVITLVRAGQEHNISYKLRESKAIEDHREFAMANAILEEIYSVFGVDVLSNETYYLAQQLIAANKYTPTNSQINQQIQILVDKMIERVTQIVGINFSEDETLRQGIKTHLEALIPRLRFKNRIHNEVLSVVKNEYPLAFQIGVIAAKVIEESEGMAVNEDEISYLAVHFGAALTRMNINADRSKQSAFIVCGAGIGTAILLKSRVEDYFKELLTVRQVMPGYKLRSADLSNVDVVISTIPIEKLPPLSENDIKKIVVVRHLLDEDEVKLIQQKLFNTTRIFAQNVDKFFRRECFVTGKTFKTKERIIDFMTGELEKLGLMDKEASDSVKEREIASPTEIGNLVAIPHPLKNSAAISSISVLVLERPILWVEHQVQVIFLLSIATSEFYLWEPIFLKLFKYLVKENGVRRLLNNPDYDAFIKDFKQSF